MNSSAATPPGGGELASGVLTHIDERGQARMVDVAAKPLTPRVAVARCVVVTKADAFCVLAKRQGGMEVVEAARFAGVQAAKRTASLIPLCHPICLDRATVEVAVDSHRIEVRAVTEIVERTGVEMEALTACAVAALTLVKALVEIDPETSIEELTLWHKSGGRSGSWERTGPDGQLTHDPVASAPRADPRPSP